MPRRSSKNDDKTMPVEDYEHSQAKRVNNPPVGLAHLDREETPIRTLTYDPHLDPQLVWAGKAERKTVEVPAPSIHVHEELSAQKIIGSIRRQRLQQPLFDIDALDPDKAVEFYEHDLNWSNRMMLGDSLMVMSSLLDRERMAGTVQCIFLDPPYGVKYNSNFQPRIVQQTRVEDGKDESLTREPETIQAYRDTWELGVHSYLSYLRDRFVVSRELLTDSGSIFVQIGPEQVHRVRALLDEVFGSENHVSTITYQKTTGSTGSLLPSLNDFIVWFAKDKSQVKYRALFKTKEVGGEGGSLYTHVRLVDGSSRRLTSKEIEDPTLVPAGARIFGIDTLTSQKPPGDFPVEFEGKTYRPRSNTYWKTGQAGMARLIEDGRVAASGSGLGYVRYLDDFPGVALGNVWTDLVGQNQFGGTKRYVVQTALKAVSRCIAMTSDPGDLVLDPTCGSGTTALVAEQSGRRWITIDTSRVALAIARERLLTAKYDFYQLEDPMRGVDGGFRYKSIQRVTLSSITKGTGTEAVTLWDQPQIDAKKIRVSGPFTVEALSRYSVNPLDTDTSAPRLDTDDTTSHVETLLGALRAQGIPRTGAKPTKIQSLTPLAGSGALQADGVAELGGKPRRFAVALGPRFGAVTMAQVGDALREAIGFDLVVFAGFAFTAEAQKKLASGKVGGTQVALLLANPDLLVGDLLKNTTASQTFRLYSSPDVKVERDADGYRVTVEGVDTFDAATGEVTSLGKSGIQAWFLDDAYDGTVFRVSQAFFPVTDAWSKLQKTLRGTVDADLIEELHGWTSHPFDESEDGKIAVRVIAQDGNASEVVLDLAEVK